jgi:hypothetical protein
MTDVFPIGAYVLANRPRNTEVPYIAAHTFACQPHITDVPLITAHIFTRQLHITAVPRVITHINHLRSAFTVAAASWSTVLRVALFWSFLCPIVPQVSLVCTCRQPWL